MAKRNIPRSEASDSTAAAPPAAKPRPRRGEPQAAEAAPADPLATESQEFEPNEDDIRLRAYHRYLERGGGHGMDFEDWLEAERELKRKG